jgi:hypothetical protein
MLGFFLFFSNYLFLFLPKKKIINQCLIKTK